jgi:serine/threonine protein kinase
MLGGVGLMKDYQGTHKDAFYQFMSNSTFNILTDSSISGITLVATLNDGASTPYVSLDADEISFMLPVKKLLLKIMPSYSSPGNVKVTSKEGAVSRNMINDTYKGTVEINSYSSILRECEIQKDIYRKSILNKNLPLVSVCPAVLYLENPVGDSDLFKSMIMGKVTPRAGRTVDEDQAQIIQYLSVSADEAPKLLGSGSNFGVNFSIIVMELLDGYMPLRKVIEKKYGSVALLPQDSYLIPLVDVELFRLHLMGYFHGDLHLGNIMFNDQKDYTGTADKGKAMIIDFGRTTNDASEFPDECKGKPSSMISQDCLYSETFHSAITWDATEPKAIMAKLTEISRKNNEKLARVSGKLLYPGKDLIESIKEYADTRVYIGGGNSDSELDVNYLREVLYGMIMQNDTPETFDLNTYLRGLYVAPPTKTYNKPINIIQPSVRQPIMVTNGGRKRHMKKTNKKHKKTKKAHKKKTKRR